MSGDADMHRPSNRLHRVTEQAQPWKQSYGMVEFDGLGKSLSEQIEENLEVETTERAAALDRDSFFGRTHVNRIEPSGKSRAVDWAEFWAYRDLFWFLVLRDVKVLYKQTVLGLGWAVVRPLFSTAVFAIVFGRLAGVPSDGAPYALFCFIAMLAWTYFSATLTASADSLVANSHLLTKVYFPRLILPMTPMAAKLVDLAVAFLVLLALMGWHGFAPGWNLVFLPFLVLLMMLTAAGMGLWLSALAVRYRDVRHAMQFVQQLLMYAAPVVWPASLIPDQYRLFYGVYPMAGVIEGFRAALLPNQPMPWDLVGVGAASAVVLTVTGMRYFRGVERFFADVA